MKLRSVLISIGFTGLLALPLFLALPSSAQLSVNLLQGEISFKRGILSSVNDNLLGVQLSDGVQAGILGVMTNAGTRIVPKFRELGTNILKWPAGLILNVVGLPKWSDQNTLGVLASSIEVDTKYLFTKTIRGSAERIEANDRLFWLVWQDRGVYKRQVVSQPINIIKNRQPVSFSELRAGDPVEVVQLWERLPGTPASRREEKIADLELRIQNRPANNRLTRVYFTGADTPASSTMELASGNKLVVVNEGAGHNVNVYLFTDQPLRFVPPAPSTGSLGMVRLGTNSRAFAITASQTESVLMRVQDSETPGTQPRERLTVWVR